MWDAQTHLAACCAAGRLETHVGEGATINPQRFRYAVSELSLSSKPGVNPRPRPRKKERMVRVCRVCRADAHRSGPGSDASGPGYIMRAHGPSADMVLQCEGLTWAEFRRYERTVAPDAAWLLLEGLAFVTIS